jgi:Helix-turn-helix domain
MKNRSPLTETERERAKVLHASGKTPSAIAKSMGRSHHTLQKFLDKPEIQKQVSVQREELAGMFDQVAHRIVGAVTPEDVTKATLQQKMVSAGIAVDKAALLRGEIPTTVNVTVLLDAVEAIREMRRVEEAARPQQTIPGNVQ